MAKISYSLQLCLVILFITGSLFSQVKTGADSLTEIPSEKKQPLTITRFETSLVIDGELRDKLWNEAVALKETLVGLKSGTKFEQFDVDEINASVCGDTAVVVSRQTKPEAMKLINRIEQPMFL